MAKCEECEEIIKILDFGEPDSLGKLKKTFKGIAQLLPKEIPVLYQSNREKTVLEVIKK
jgi:hypothetical protein